MFDLVYFHEISCLCAKNQRCMKSCHRHGDFDVEDEIEVDLKEEVEVEKELICENLMTYSYSYCSDYSDCCDGCCFVN